MPLNCDEAKAVFDGWDRLNGRYYVRADVRLSNDQVYRDVTFDADRYIAVRINGWPVYDRPELFGLQVVAFLITRDRSPSRDFRVATREERAAFDQK
jgi:hypothetical protein